MKRKNFAGFLLFYLLFSSSSLPGSESAGHKSFSGLNGANDTYQILSASWSDPVDLDGDGIPRNSYLCFIVTCDQSGTKTLYAKIYYRLATLKMFVEYITTPNFTITGRQASLKPQKVLIGWPNTVLGPGTCDFAIDIFLENSRSVVASLGPADDVDLNNQKFQDKPMDGDWPYVYLKSVDTHLYQGACACSRKPGKSHGYFSIGQLFYHWNRNGRRRPFPGGSYSRTRP